MRTLLGSPRPFITAALFVVGASVAPACGDAESSSDSAGTGGAASGGSPAIGDFSTGVARDTPAGDLTAEELQQLCDATAEYVESFAPQEVMCRAAGVLASLAGAQLLQGADSDTSDLATPCLAAEQACLAVEQAPVACSEVPADCEVTVGQYEDCVEDFAQSFGPFLRVVPECEGLAPQALLAFAFAPTELPSSCAAVQEACPALLPGLGDFPLDPPDTAGGWGGAGGQSASP